MTDDVEVVSAALDRIQLIADTPLRYDPDQKLWVYSHRLRHDQRTISRSEHDA